MSDIMARIGAYLLKQGLALECRQAGLRTGSTPLAFGRIAYLQRGHSAGASEAIVALHGAASDNTCWIRFSRHLRCKLPLLLPDLPGHGGSIGTLDLDYGIHAQAARLQEWLAALGIRRVHLIGNSMGGALAIMLAASAPELVASLVLINPAGVETSPSWLRQEIARTGVNPMIEVQDARSYRAMMRIGMATPPYVPGLLVSALARQFAQRVEINRKITRDIERDLDQRDNLAAVAATSLIVWGTADKVLHADDARELQRRLANSRLVLLDELGHVPMVEAPRQVADLCSRFLSEHVDGRSADLKHARPRQAAVPARHPEARATAHPSQGTTPHG